jgi:hypothetical protein
MKAAAMKAAARVKMMTELGTNPIVLTSEPHSGDFRLSRRLKGQNLAGFGFNPETTAVFSGVNTAGPISEEKRGSGWRSSWPLKA